MWEYKREVISYRLINELDEKLKEIGDNNWEIIYYKEIPKENENFHSILILSKRFKIV